MRNWKAIYIYYYDNQDLLITNGIYPILKKYKITDFFFIRYWQHGPHIRLRLLNIDKNLFENIKLEINKFVKENPSKTRIDEEEYRKLSTDYAKKENISENFPRIWCQITLSMTQPMSLKLKNFMEKQELLLQKKNLYIVLTLQ